MNHGWALADAALRTFMSDLLPKAIPAGKEPSPKLLFDPALAAEALKDSSARRLFGH